MSKSGEWQSFTGKYNSQMLCDRILREDIMESKSVGIPKEQVIALLSQGNFKGIEKEVRQLIDEVYADDAEAQLKENNPRVSLEEMERRLREQKD